MNRLNIREHPMPWTPEFEKWSRAKTLASDTEGRALVSDPKPTPPVEADLVKNPGVPVPGGGDKLADPDGCGNQA